MSKADRPTGSGTLHMRHSEAAFLANYLRVLNDWDARSCVRIQQRGLVAGFFGAPPTSCISFIALPLLATVSEADIVADRTVSAGRLRDIIGDVANQVGVNRSVRIPEAVTGPSELAMLPRRDGWDVLATGQAQDVLPSVEQAVAEFRAKVPDSNADIAYAQREADRIWSKPGWEGIPIRALHTAKSLGFLANPEASVQAARTKGWSRLVTPSGQIFSSDEVGTLSLRLMVN